MYLYIYMWIFICVYKIEDQLVAFNSINHNRAKTLGVFVSLSLCLYLPTVTCVAHCKVL